MAWDIDRSPFVELFYNFDPTIKQQKTFERLHKKNPGAAETYVGQFLLPRIRDMQNWSLAHGYSLQNVDSQKGVKSDRRSSTTLLSLP